MFVFQTSKVMPTDANFQQRQEDASKKAKQQDKMKYIPVQTKSTNVSLDDVKKILGDDYKNWRVLYQLNTKSMEKNETLSGGDYDVGGLARNYELFSQVYTKGNYDKLTAVCDKLDALTKTNQDLLATNKALLAATKELVELQKKK
ncbi:MAG: hypothetical protein WC861_04215 [Candidatus Micrarchaeia archaeon]